MAAAGPVVVPNFIDNNDPNPTYYIDPGDAIAGDPDTRCVSGEVPVDHALGDDVYAQDLLSDDGVPSSQGTDEGRHFNAFGLIRVIKEEIIIPCHADRGHFYTIRMMIRSLFCGNPGNPEILIFPKFPGFVGFTPAGGLLSEYTATIYYAVTNSSHHYHDIIKIILHVMHTMQELHVRMQQSFREVNISSAFKLDRGVKSGDTIKLILSLTFGTGVGANVILIPILNIVGFNLSSTSGGILVTSIQTFFTPLLPPNINQAVDGYRIFDLIARIRLYANQEAFGALIEPTDAENRLLLGFFTGITQVNLRAFIQFIKFAFYDEPLLLPEPQNKNFAFFLNIFFNFFKVSMNIDPADPRYSRSTAKLMYTNFFSTYNNYGSIIRIFNNMMTQNLYDGILLNQHAIMFLSGSNAARAYKLIEELLNLDTREMNEGQIRERRAQLYDTHMATLSDNDFMFYLLNAASEVYRLIIRMMLGACLYYLKHILTQAEYVNFTDSLEQSISIVGHDDHLLAQRLNANTVFLERCFNTIMRYDGATLTGGITILDILAEANFHGFDFYRQLSGNVTLAFLDVVFKHNTAESWYISVFSIFQITLYYAGGGITIQSYQIQEQARVVLGEDQRDVLTFLTTQAMAVNCIATPWTLILNILYTIFVTENCVARIVVGKLGNDPKNLEKYFSILNTHLTQLREQYVSDDMLAAITTISRLQLQIIRDSQLCQHPGDEHPPLWRRYDTLKNSCTVWVQEMFKLAVNPQKRELFFLSAAYPFTPPRRATRLERGICYAWKLDGNICNRGEFLEQFTAERVDEITRETFQPVYIGETMGNSEQGMHLIVPRLQGIISQAIAISAAPNFNVTPITPGYVANPPPLPPPPPPLPPPPPPLPVNEALINHYEYMNILWKRLTKRSIDLRSMFKSNVKDLKRIVGSKNFTAISLVGAYPCLLLIDELLESNNTDNRRALTDEKTSNETLNCRRGLLPLLVPGTNRTLFAKMVVELLHGDYQYRLNANAAAANPVAAAAANEIYSTNNILIFLGFLFSIKIKSSASIGPRNMLSLVDSIINFGNMPMVSRREITQLLTYTGTKHGPVAAGRCSLVPLSLNPDTDACAIGGVVVHSGGAPKAVPPVKTSSEAKNVAAALTNTPAAPVKASSAPVKGTASDKASAAIAPGVSKLDSKGKKQHKAAQEAIVYAEKKGAANKLLYPLLNPELGPFKIFMDKIKEVFTTGIQGIFVANSIPFNPKTCVSGITRQEVFNFDTFYNRDPYAGLPISVGGSNKKTKTNSKLSKPNNHTRRNKNNRKKNSKTKTKTKTKAKSCTKYKKVIPYSRSGSQSNRKKSKPKKSQKNVTFKRRRARK
jgi:hypothetical protein